MMLQVFKYVDALFCGHSLPGGDFEVTLVAYRLTNVQLPLPARSPNRSPDVYEHSPAIRSHGTPSCLERGRRLGA
jgi:hypothetical protein